MEAPQQLYRRLLVERIASMTPSTVLDVGCGDGGLLRTLATELGIAGTGLDVEGDLVMRLRSDGLEAACGRAEALPYDDASFDLVVMAYSAHHIEHLATALVEAGRVARRGILILDPWYDDSFASQRVARRFDGWMKAIDRRTGMIHNDCPTAGELATPFAAGGFAIDHVHRLVLCELPIDRVHASASRQMATVALDAAMASELDDILVAAAADGISQDGAILFAACRDA